MGLIDGWVGRTGCVLIGFSGAGEAGADDGAALSYQIHDGHEIVAADAQLEDDVELAARAA